MAQEAAWALQTGVMSSLHPSVSPHAEPSGAPRIKGDLNNFLFISLGVHPLEAL